MRPPPPNATAHSSSTAPLHCRSVRCWAVAAGLVMFLSELLLAGSLLTFQAPAAVQAFKAAALDMAAPGKLARMGVRERLLNLLIISILYIPVSCQQECLCAGWHLGGRFMQQGCNLEVCERRHAPLLVALNAALLPRPCRAADAPVLCGVRAHLHGAACHHGGRPLAGRPVCLLLGHRIRPTRAHGAARVARLPGLDGRAAGAIPPRLAGCAGGVVGGGSVGLGRLGV